MRRDNAGKRARFEAAMDAVDAELARGGGPYFMGAELSLVECVFAPMLERIAASIPYYKGLVVRGTGCAASFTLGRVSVFRLVAASTPHCKAWVVRGAGSALPLLASHARAPPSSRL